MGDVELIKVTTEAGIRKYGLGCLSNQKHPGFEAKLKWLKREFKKRINLNCSNR